MFVEDLDGILKWKPKSSDDIVVFDEAGPLRNDPRRYSVFLLARDGTESFISHFDNPSDALIEFAQRIRQ